MGPNSKSEYDVDLAVTLQDSPDAEPRHFRLRSTDGLLSTDEGSVESNLPDPAAALAAVEQFGEEIFFPVPRPDRICTQQYGGPQRATVSGLFLGREVYAEFSLTDGCRIADWERIAALLGARPGML